MQRFLRIQLILSLIHISNDELERIIDLIESIKQVG